MSLPLSQTADRPAAGPVGRPRVDRSVDRPTVWSLNYLCLLAAVAVAWALVGYVRLVHPPVRRAAGGHPDVVRNELRRRRHQVANGAAALHPGGGE